MTHTQKIAAYDAKLAALHLLIERRTTGRLRLALAIDDLLAMIGRGLKGE